MSIRPAIELKDGGAIFSNSTSKRRIVSDVVMKDLVPYSSSPDSKDRPMELGKGASGGAHLFRDRRSPAILYAVKSVGLFGESNRNQVLHELEALAETGSSGDEGERSITPSERQKVSDEHCVVHLHGHSIEKNQMQLILEYMNLGGLDRLVKTGCKVPEKVVAGMMWQVFEALKYMKTVKNMMHRDIKPANILWCTNGRVKVGDFGISRKMSDDNQAHTFLGMSLSLFLSLFLSSL
jgi:serine/threonine protein kinase